MDPRLQALIDRFEIIDSLNQYCHGCDRSDETRMADVYLPDSWDNHGPLQAAGPEFSRLVILAGATTESLTHQLGQSSVNITGDKAGAETYFIATKRVIKDGIEYLDQMGGRYVDEFERREGRWRIKSRICIREWSIRHPLAQDWLVGAGFVEGLRSREDPSYAVLGLNDEQQTAKTSESTS